MKIVIDSDTLISVIADAVKTVMGENGLCFYDKRGKETYGGRPWSNEDRLRREMGEEAVKALEVEMRLQESDGDA